jgi:hypothetical protein
MFGNPHCVEHVRGPFTNPTGSTAAGSTITPTTTPDSHHSNSGDQNLNLDNRIETFYAKRQPDACCCPNLLGSGNNVLNSRQNQNLMQRAHTILQARDVSVRFSLQDSRACSHPPGRRQHQRPRFAHPWQLDDHHLRATSVRTPHGEIQAHANGHPRAARPAY